VDLFGVLFIADLWKIEDAYHIVSKFRPGCTTNARDAAIFFADLSLGKRMSSLFALNIQHLVFRLEQDQIHIECTFYFDKVLTAPHTLTLTPHPEREKDPVYPLVKVPPRSPAGNSDMC
jgi:hypothetical protein